MAIKLVLQLCKTLLLWLFVTTILILLILLPRGDSKIDYSKSRVEMTEEYEKNITTFSWESYKNNITDFFSYAIKNRSLGQTEYGVSVEFEVWRYTKKSIYILLPSIIISFIFGVVKGIYDFKVGKKAFNLFGEKITSFFLSVPDFFVIIAIQVGIMALIDLGFPHVKLYGSETLSNKLFAIGFLSIYPTFYIARITENYLSSESGRDYVRTAIGKGTSSKKIIYLHMLNNCWIRVVGQINTLVLYILSNLFIVEFLTGYRGGAYRFYQAFHVPKQFSIGSSMNIDIPIVVEFIVLFTTIVLLTKIVSDMIHSILLRREATIEK